MSGRSNYLERQRRQDAVYWGNPQDNGYGGKTFNAPVQIKVRWSVKQVLFADASGQQVLSDAVVHVGEDLDIDGYLYLGTLDDLSSEEGVNPLVLAGAFAIKAKSEVPNLQATDFVRKVWLRKG